MLSGWLWYDNPNNTTVQLHNIINTKQIANTEKTYIFTQLLGSKDAFNHNARKKEILGNGSSAALMDS